MAMNGQQQINVQVPEMGGHLILEFCGVTSVDLNNFEQVNPILQKIIKESGATIESQQHKIFEPQGITILYLLSESHFSIHTWPEHKSCAIDFYHCGDKAIDRLKGAEKKICDIFGWEFCTSSILLNRGLTSHYGLNQYEDKSTIYNNLKFVHQEQSKYQDIRVYDSNDMGRIMCLDGMIQVTKEIVDNYTIDLTRKVVENKEKVYNEVLIIGGGDMLIPHYLLSNYPNIKKLTVCEIDDRVVEVVRKYNGYGLELNKWIEEGRLEVKIDDGAKFVKEKVAEGKTYDAIITDNTDVYIATGPARSLFTSEFFKNINTLLNKDACFSQQVSDEPTRQKWDTLIRGAGFKEISYIYSDTPEYSTQLPLGICRKY